MRKQSKIHLAVLSGICATSGGVCAKLAGFYDIVEVWNCLAKVLLLVTMVINNTLGCTLFVKALAGSSSSVPATVVASSVNYFGSALMGTLLFNEATSLRWWCGTSLILLGLLLICNSAQPTSLCNGSEDQKEAEERKHQ